MQKQEYESKLVSLDKIKPCFFESRIETSDESFMDLVASVKKYGVIEPIVVRPLKETGDYQRVAGKRRYCAAKEAGLKEIPVIVRDLSEEDAFFLQATENLQRQGLSEDEKTRIVTESAKRYKLDAKGISEKLGMSYPWVCRYLPSEFKNGEMARLGQKGGEALAEAYRKSDVALQRRAELYECEFCGVSTTEPKEWENHKLCPIHYAEALGDPAKFKRFFGFQQQEPVLGKAKPLEIWEESDIHKNVDQNEMIETISQLAVEKGITPIITNRKYSVTTIIHLMFPSKNLVVYLDPKTGNNSSQLKTDNELREWLRNHHGMRVLSITYGSKSKGEVDRIFNEIAREVKKE